MGKKLDECELLNRIIKILGPNGEHWTRGTFKTDRGGGDFAYCLVGAFRESSRIFKDEGRVAFEERMPITTELIKEAQGYYRPDIFQFNDTGTWGKIKQLLDKARQKACPAEKKS